MHRSSMPELASNVGVCLILALVVVRLENVGANRTVGKLHYASSQTEYMAYAYRVRIQWVFAPRASFTFKC